MIMDLSETIPGWWFGTWLLFFHILGILPEGKLSEMPQISLLLNSRSYHRTVAQQFAETKKSADMPIKNHAHSKSLVFLSWLSG